MNRRRHPTHHDARRATKREGVLSGYSPISGEFQRGMGLPPKLWTVRGISGRGTGGWGIISTPPSTMKRKAKRSAVTSSAYLNRIGKEHLLPSLVVSLWLIGSFKGVCWPGQNPNIHVEVGPQEEVLRPYSFGLTDFPDGLMGIVRKEGRYYWFVGSFAPEDRTKTYTFRFLGEHLHAMRPDPLDRRGSAVPVLQPGPEGSYDDHIAGNGTVYLDDATGKLYFWYQAMRGISEAVADNKQRHFGEESAIYPAYSSIGLAVSEDLGRTWRKLGTPLTLNLTWNDFIQDNSICCSDSLPPAVVRHGEFLYMYYVDYPKPPHYTAWQLAVARLPVQDLDKAPQPWKKYLQGAFSEPARGGRFTPLIEEMGFLSVSFNTYWNQWIMIHNVDEWKIFLRTSTDGIRWSPPKTLVESPDPRDYLLHPTIVGLGENPGITGQEFWIYYGYAPNKRADPGGWMVRRKVRLGK